MAFSKHLLKRLTFLIITHTGWCKSYSDWRSESMSACQKKSAAEVRSCTGCKVATSRCNFPCQVHKVLYVL